LIGHTDTVWDAVFDPSGDRIATASRDGTVRVWDSDNGQPEVVFRVESPPVIPSFSSAGSLLAATAFDGTTRVWDLETEEERWVAGPPGGITINLSFSPDDSLLAVTRIGDGVVDDLSALVFDVATGELIRTLEGHNALDVGFTPDGSRLLTAGADGTVRIWDTQSGEHLDTYTGHKGPVSDLQVSADGSMVASSGAVDVKVWNLSTFELEAEIFGHTGEVWAIDLSPDADLLLTATKADGTTRLWDLSPYWSHELIGLPGPKGEGGIVYSPNGATLVASGEAGRVSVWDVLTGNERHVIERTEQVYRLDIDPGGSFLATAGVTGAEVHDLSRGEDISTLVTGVETFDVDFGPHGLLATASFDGVRLWESHGGSGELISDLHGRGVAFDPQGTMLAMSLAEGGIQASVEIRDLGSGETISTLTEHSPNLVRGLTFDSTGDFLVTASDDATAIVWDTATLEPIHRLEGHAAAIVNADFDPNRPEVATAGFDGTVKIWNVETGILRLTLSAPGALSDIAYSPDGRYLAAIGPEGFVTVYMRDVDELVAEAESRLTRWWSESECLQYLQTEECPPTPEGLHQ
jgi:WD40 repeat protein